MSFKFNRVRIEPELKKGHRVLISQRPDCWSSVKRTVTNEETGNYPLNLGFPRVVIVDKVTNWGGHMAFRDADGFSWSLKEGMIISGVDFYYTHATPENIDTLKLWARAQGITVGDIVGRSTYSNDRAYNPANFTSTFGRFLSQKEFFMLEGLEEPKQTSIDLTKQSKNTETKMANEINTPEKKVKVNLEDYFVKEIFKTRTLKLNGLDREVTIAVLADKHGFVHAGYAVRNPEYDKTHDEEMAKRISKGRAMKSSLLRDDSGDTQFLLQIVDKHILRGIADYIFSQISKKKIQIKGVK